MMNAFYLYLLQLYLWQIVHMMVLKNEGSILLMNTLYVLAIELGKHKGLLEMLVKACSEHASWD